MKNIIKLINDIFSMSFDIIIPVSGNIVAVLAAVALFSVRYFTFRQKQKKYAGQTGQRRLTPRVQSPWQEGHRPLEAARYCDEEIYRFFSYAVAQKGQDLDPDGQMDRRFRGEMAARLRGKAPPRDAEEAMP